MKYSIKLLFSVLLVFCLQGSINSNAGFSEWIEKKRLQRALRIEGLRPGPIDGKFGSQTRRAISIYQRRLGHEITGYLSLSEKARLLNIYARDNRKATAGALALLGIIGGVTAANTKNRNTRIAIAAITGAVATAILGVHLDVESRRRKAEAAKHAFFTKRKAYWTNPNTGTSGTITPVAFFNDAKGQACSNSSLEDKVGNKTIRQENFRTCLKSDGTLTFSS